MKRLLFLVGLGIVLSLGAMTTAAQAQATRTWVSGVGDDANPCSRTAPCKTWPGAIAKTAECGEIDALDPGGFGVVTITKGITLDGGGGEGGQVASILASGNQAAITVNISSTTCQKVVIRNMDLTGSAIGSLGGTGIQVVTGQAVSVENVWIQGFNFNGINLAPTTGHTNLTVRNSMIENNGGAGILSAAATGINRVAIVNTTIQRSGAFGSSAALTVGNGSDVDVLDSTIVQNPGGGVLANQASAKVSLTNSMISDNQVFGIHASGSGIVQISNCLITFNAGTGLLADTGGQILTWMNNFVSGNSPDGARTGTVVPM